MPRNPPKVARKNVGLDTHDGGLALDCSSGRLIAVGWLVEGLLSSRSSCLGEAVAFTATKKCRCEFLRSALSAVSRIAPL